MANHFLAKKAAGNLEESSLGLKVNSKVPKTKQNKTYSHKHTHTQHIHTVHTHKQNTKRKNNSFAGVNKEE